MQIYRQTTTDRDIPTDRQTHLQTDTPTDNWYIGYVFLELCIYSYV